jgi:hypothetical protein
MLAAMMPPARAGYDCYDGKSDDCTLEWSLAHRPKDPTWGAQKDPWSGHMIPAPRANECVAMLTHKQGEFSKIGSQFEVTGVMIDSKSGLTQVGGHGTDWYDLANVRLSSGCSNAKLWVSFGDWGK